MFQKGTGERFKYKQIVKQSYPNAKCKKYTYQGNITVYAVSTEHERISTMKTTAEKAWADAWTQININHK